MCTSSACTQQVMYTGSKHMPIVMLILHRLSGCSDLAADCMQCCQLYGRLKSVVDTCIWRLQATEEPTHFYSSEALWGLLQ